MKRIDLKKMFKARYEGYVIPDEKEAVAFCGSAGTAPRKKRFFVRGAAAAAACMMLILGLALGIPDRDEHGEFVIKPGILTISSFAMEGGEMREIVMEEGVELPRGADWSLASSMRGITMKLSFPEDGVSFRVSADAGSLSYSEWYETPAGLRKRGVEVGQNHVLTEPDTIYWRNLEYFSYEDPESEFVVVYPTKSYLCIVTERDGHILGYSLVEISLFSESTGSFRAKILKSVSFPKVDGEYQAVTGEWIEREINKIKAG